LSPAALPALFNAYLATCWSRRAGHEGGLSSRFEAMLVQAEPLVFSRVVAGDRRGLLPVRVGA
jgi:hypothetical protein